MKDHSSHVNVNLFPPSVSNAQKQPTRKFNPRLHNSSSSSLLLPERVKTTPTPINRHSKPILPFKPIPRLIQSRKDRRADHLLLRRRGHG